MIPAFGIPAAEIDLLSKKGCIVVDTTCGSVLNVWKNVERYARAGITSVIHGKFEHEETEATFSRTSLFAGAHYLVIRDKTEAGLVCNYIENGGDKAEFTARFRRSISGGFDPDLHLERIGLANQTTMLSSNRSRLRMLRVAMNNQYSPEELAERFYSFDTIVGLRDSTGPPDAVRNLEKSSMDLMMVIGGYSSSNTNNLAKIAATFTPTFHIQDAASIVDAGHDPA